MEVLAPLVLFMPVLDCVYRPDTVLGVHMLYIV